MQTGCGGNSKRRGKQIKGMMGGGIKKKTKAEEMQVKIQRRKQKGKSEEQNGKQQSVQTVQQRPLPRPNPPLPSTICTSAVSMLERCV